MNFRALDAVILIKAKLNALWKLDYLNIANINSYKTSAITQHLLNCPDALYLANLNTFPDLDSSEEFSDKIHCPTSLAYTNSKILYSCKYNNPNQLLILEFSEFALFSTSNIAIMFSTMIKIVNVLWGTGKLQ